MFEHLPSVKPARVGKVKDVYDEGETLLFKFSNRISVFDQIIPNLIPGKGESLCRTSTFWFKLVADTSDISTHYIETPSPEEMRVMKFYVPEKKGNPFEVEYMIPLEFIMRYHVAGTLFDRIRKGTITPQEVGIKHQPEYGEELIDPYFEVTTKFEKFDRPLKTGDVIEIGGMSKSELRDIEDTVLKIDRRISREVGKRGLIHVDGKKEFAFGPSREPVLIDTFGTVDEDRFWEKKEFDNGNIVELSKEFVRQYYRNTGHHQNLYEAREKGLPEPPIPELPPSMVGEVSDLYSRMFERITGEKWR